MRALLDFKQQTGFIILHILIISLLLIVIGIGVFYSPKKFYLTEESLVIYRVGDNKAFDLADIKEVHKLNKPDMGGLTRTWGVGGFFGYFGKFYSSKLGTLDFYTSRRSNLILLMLEDGHKVVISPDNMRFYDTLRERTSKDGAS